MADFDKSNQMMFTSPESELAENEYKRVLNEQVLCHQLKNEQVMSNTNYMQHRATYFGA